MSEPNPDANAVETGPPFVAAYVAWCEHGHLIQPGDTIARVLAPRTLGPIKRNFVHVGDCSK